MTPGFEHQSTASHDGGERGSGSNSRRIPPGARLDPLRAGVSQERAALTIATMPAFRSSGMSGHASTTAARSGLSSGAGATTQTRVAPPVARKLREGPGTAGLGHDEEIEPSSSDVARIPEIWGLAGLGRSDSEYQRWDLNPHGGFPPEDFKSSEGVDVNQSDTGGLHQLSDRLSLHLPYGTEFPPDLVAIVAAWPELPEAIKAGILAMVKAAAGNK